LGGLELGGLRRFRILDLVGDAGGDFSDDFGDEMSRTGTPFEGGPGEYGEADDLVERLRRKAGHLVIHLVRSRDRIVNTTLASNKIILLIAGARILAQIKYLRSVKVVSVRVV
jgi:hypothetical protein